MFAPVVIVLLDLLDRRRNGLGQWILLGVFLVAVMGAKAVYMPMVGLGLIAAVVGQALRGRGSRRSGPRCWRSG
nr:hypothetical protein GCM10020093_089470 [Planobispora longispora]